MSFLHPTMSKGSPIGALYWKNAVKSDGFGFMSSASSNAPVALPFLIAAFVEATNSFDLEGLMVTFADDMLVNDQLGETAIRGCAERDILGEG
jgi:hypothetical protein